VSIAATSVPLEVQCRCVAYDAEPEPGHGAYIAGSLRGIHYANLQRLSPLLYSPDWRPLARSTKAHAAESAHALRGLPRSTRRSRPVHQSRGLARGVL